MPARQKTDPQLERTRRLIFRAFVGLLALLIGGGLLYSVGAFDSLIAGNDQYAVVPGTKPPAAHAPITVTEFFSYGCPHCNDFDPQVEAWRKAQPTDVIFERSPASFGSAQYVLYARAYFALLGLGALEQNHSRLFTEIHQRGHNFVDSGEVAAFVAGHGATQAVMQRAMASPRVDARIEAAQRAEQQYGVQAIPTLVVGGHYRIDIGTVGRAQALHIATRLIETLRAGHPPAGAASNSAKKTAP